MSFFLLYISIYLCVRERHEGESACCVYSLPCFLSDEYTEALKVKHVLYCCCISFLQYFSDYCALLQIIKSAELDVFCVKYGLFNKT